MRCGKGRAPFAPGFVLTGCFAIIFGDCTLLDVRRGTPPGGNPSISRHASKFASAQKTWFQSPPLCLLVVAADEARTRVERVRSGLVALSSLH